MEKIKKNAIFIAATGQNVGKTTICLGVIAALRRRFSTVGFIKPVGQHHLNIDNHTIVDKDAYLFKHHFQIDSEWKDMSPVIIPSGFTREYLDGKFTVEEMVNRIKMSYEKISKSHNYTVVEGTGHVGVGSIVDLCNARIAAELNLDMVIIASGGLGSAYDELSLSVAMCEKYGVKVRGVILNRVLENKKEMLLDYFPKSLKKWGIPLIGTIPYDSFLSKSSVKDFEILFEGSLISGNAYRNRHFESVRLVAGSLEEFQKEMVQSQLIITPASREDIILAILAKHKDVAQEDGSDYRGGIILTDKHPPSSKILNEIRLVNIPVLYTSLSSYDAMKKITSFIAKIRIEDVMKIDKAIHLVEKNINFDALCENQNIPTKLMLDKNRIDFSVKR